MHWLIWHFITLPRMRRLAETARHLLTQGEDIGWLIEEYDELADLA